jgi:hypothetical protein
MAAAFALLVNDELDVYDADGRTWITTSTASIVASGPGHHGAHILIAKPQGTTKFLITRNTVVLEHSEHDHLSTTCGIFQVVEVR